MSRKVAFLLLFVVMIFCFFFFSSYEKSSVQFLPSPDHRVETEFNEWNNCVLKIISIYENDAEGLWSHLPEGTRRCEVLPFMANLSIKDIRNLDETKRHIFPLQNTSCIIVTLGIGHDIVAEEKLIEVLPKGSKFYGADPIYEANEDLYKKIGAYFPFAVGSKSKIYTASVLINGTYVDRNVVHIEFVYFLSVLLGHKVYDEILIDIEGTEHELFPYFYRGGELDRNGITVCQFNIEVHSKNTAEKEMFSRFIFQILRDNRYAFFRIVQGIYIQMYFLNFSDSDCVSKYIVRNK